LIIWIKFIKLIYFSYSWINTFTTLKSVNVTQLLPIKFSNLNNIKFNTNIVKIYKIFYYFTNKWNFLFLFFIANNDENIFKFLTKLIVNNKKIFLHVWKNSHTCWHYYCFINLKIKPNSSLFNPNTWKTIKYSQSYLSNRNYYFDITTVNYELKKNNYNKLIRLFFFNITFNTHYFFILLNFFSLLNQIKYFYLIANSFKINLSQLTYFFLKNNKKKNANLEPVCNLNLRTSFAKNLILYNSFFI
jgi:hypothetical protein